MNVTAMLELLLYLLLGGAGGGKLKSKGGATVTQPTSSEGVQITKLLVQRREFWYAVLALIGAVLLIVLATLWLYPELLSEIVHLWEEEPPVYVAPRLLEPYDHEWTYPEGWPTLTPHLAPTIEGGGG